MSNETTILNCQVSGNTVYIKNQRGAIVETFSFPQPPIAQSFGNGVSITCGTLCYNYVLNEQGRLVQSGMYGV